MIWFRRRKSAYAHGFVPVTWQGLLVVVAFAITNLVSGFLIFHGHTDALISRFPPFGIIFLTTGFLVAVIAQKTSEPLK